MKKLIVNCGQIVTPIGSRAKSGAEMDRVRIYQSAAIEMTDGFITAVAPQDSFDRRKYRLIDAGGQAVIPGFVDSHTHYVFAGNRRDEFFMRAGGKSYLEIMQSGGGIQNTVGATRQAPYADLLEICRKRLNRMLLQGITTVEGKSGYGLDLNTELKQLRIMQELNNTHPAETVLTFLGGHAVPEEFRGEPGRYIGFLLNRVLPAVREEKLAEFCDIFCEHGAFTPQESKRFLRAAGKMGFGLKIHADEITSSGGAELAAGLSAVSADHLLAVSEAGMEKLAASGTIAVLLPCTAFCLRKAYAPARKMIDRGCAVALASDYNPGSCHCDFLPLLLALAFFNMQMTAGEILTAMTLNGAAAVGRADRVGSIEAGKQADILILGTPDYRDLLYHTGENIVETVIKKGGIAVKDGKRYEN